MGDLKNIITFKIIINNLGDNLFIIVFHLILSLFFVTSKIYGQEVILNTHQHFIFHFPEDSVLQWSETIIPGTIHWEKNGNTIDVPFLLLKNKIIPDRKNWPKQKDTLQVNFSTLPYSFHQRQMLWDSSQIRISAGDLVYSPVTTYTGNPLFESKGLAYDGALTRGFSLGNNQSLVFDSELNLQLNGNIGDGYHIRAAITDQNLPIQPDGTTRQIQEFDKVFIEINKDQHSILAGDFEAAQTNGYFMRYNRKLKGLQYVYNGSKNQQPWHIKSSAAVSKGRFTRQILVPAEGNQGPYPLKGENGELYIIVLAGSEKVFLDGNLLVRGEDADYIMDYNKSEITFTPKILINAHHRITIEFQYAQFNFQKSINTLEALYKRENIDAYFHLFQENDSKSVTGDLNLTAEDLDLLRLAGDAGSQFNKSGIKESVEGYNSNLILYALMDTLVHSVIYRDILTWSTDPQKAKFLVTFSEVGQGNGDYTIRPDPSPNGRIYIWIAPDPVTGEKRGNFAPVIPLQAPQQKQMFTTGGEYRWDSNGKINAEFGLSRQDLNRYSSINDNDNNGIAMKVTLAEMFSLGKSWQLSPLISYEGNDTQFRSLDPYRNPEFSRDWSLPQNTGPAREQMPSIRLRLSKGNSFFTQYQFDGLYRSLGYSGNKHSGQIGIDTSGWKLAGMIGILEAKDISNKSRLFRPSMSVERVVRKADGLSIGLKYYNDRNEVRTISNQNLAGNSFEQNQLSVYIKNSREGNNHFFAGYNMERPKIPFANELKSSEKVNEWMMEGHFHQLKNIKMAYTIKNRNTTSILSTPGAKSRNLLGRIDLSASVLKKSIKWSSGYEIGNGQEPKTEYKYVKVQKGEGNYIWIDNGNGIEEINEFEIAPFSDQGEYIRLLAFNTEFIRTRALGFLQSLHLDLNQIKQTGWISKIDVLSTYQLNRKIREDEGSPYWNPFYHQYADTSILNLLKTWRNILYWNRSSTVYDFQAGYIHQENQVLQTSGYELRELRDITMRWRVSLRKKMDIVLNGRSGVRSNTSQYFEDRNYRISQFEAGPELNVILKEKFRLTGLYQYLTQENTKGQEHLVSHKISIESVWRRNSRSDIRGQMSLVQIDYISSGNTSVDFVLLQGLQKGTNLLWSLQFNTRLNASLNLTFQYNGRNTGDAKTIHTGSAQVRANF